MTTGEEIKACRLAAGLTQKQLGEAAGYTEITAQPFVASWEAGTRPIPRDKIRAVAKALNIEPAELI
jgi:transcriptional regulator with XRE-family HTH domain